MAGETLRPEELELPKTSGRALAILGMLGDPQVDLRAVAAAIMEDPLLASAVVGFANSPLYRRPHEINNVRAAVQVLGLKAVRSAVVLATLRAGLPPDNLAGEVVLGHAQRVAAGCRALARRTCPEEADDLEFMGLMHDAGMLVMAANFPARYDAMLEQALARGTPVNEAEREAFGMDHDPVTARVALAFRLPRLDAQLFRGLHSKDLTAGQDPQLARDQAVLVAAHHLLEEGGQARLRQSFALSRAAALATLGLEEDHWEAAREEMAERLAAP